MFSECFLIQILIIKQKWILLKNAPVIQFLLARVKWKFESPEKYVPAVAVSFKKQIESLGEKNSRSSL